MVYQIIVDISNSEVDKIFDYNAPFKVEIGQRVLVPFGRTTVEGFCIGIKEKSEYDTKDIVCLLDEFVAIPKELLALGEFLRKKSLRYIDCLRLFIPTKLRGGRVKTLLRNFIYLSDFESKTDIKNENQHKIIEYFKENLGCFENQLPEDFSLSTINTLIKKGYLSKEKKEVGRIPFKGFEKENKTIVYTDEQQKAIDTINRREDKIFLIHGVTGSGKTEIYLNIIENQLKAGKSAIMLVPEISLTPQMLGIFRGRFKDNVSLIHSGLGDGERFDEWRKLLDGKAKVALGARSCIFAPLENLGVIIIDEEHDTSYISDSNPRYQTIDVAKFRANYNHCKLILGSATPSLESYKLAKEGIYELIVLKERANKKVMPKLEIIDMRKEISKGNNSIFSNQLLYKLEETLKEGNQTMLFINRRGYASFQRCVSCGYVAKCEDCDVSLTYHKEEEKLKCHYCGKQYYPLTVCPKCGNKRMKDGKIGTERIVYELKKLFPQIRVGRLDNDTTTTKDSYMKILSSFANHEQDVLVGTQMIAKGHDFKDVTLVGILDADLSLYFSDYRSNERTFQLITQVAGRAGRENKEGIVILQTYNPDHYVFSFAQRYDYERFYEKESNLREVTKFPPYSTIIRILVQGKEEVNVVNKTRELYEKIKVLEGKNNIFRVQAMRCPIKKIKTLFRFQILIWTKEDYYSVNFEAVAKLIDEVKTQKDTKDISFFTEINPLQLF